MQIADSSGNRKDWSSRRRFLMLSGFAGTAALAGCSSKKPAKGGTQQTNAKTSSGGATASGNGGSGQSSNEALTVPGRYVPTNLQWNSYAPSHYAQQGAKMVFDPFLFYNQKTDTLIPYLFRDWSVDGKRLTVTLREGETWHNGDKVTAEDVVTKFKIDRGFGNQVSSYVDDAKAVDTHTVRYSLAKPYREETIMLVLEGSWMDTPANEKYGDFAKRFENASTTKEKQKIQGDVQSYQPKEPLGCGPFEFDSTNQQTLNLTKYDEHPDADKITFPKYQVVYESSNQKQWAAMKNGLTLDATTTTFFPKRIVKSLPEYVQEYRMPAYNGESIVFNHDDEDFGNRNVRRAVAYVINQNKLANLLGPAKTAVTVPAGVGSFVTGSWKQNLGGDVSVYEQYNDTSKATTLLKGEGYTKKNSKWYKPDGKRFTLTIPSPAGWSDVVSMTAMVAEMLTDFGIETQNKSIENTAFFGQYWGPSNFKLVPWFWNNSAKSKPFFSLSWILTSGTVRSTLNYPEKPEVPPMGKPDGKATPTDVRSTLQQLGTANDQKEVTKLTRELAWVVNQSLPMVPLVEVISQSFWNGKRWNLPPQDTKKQYVHDEYYYWPRIGLVSPT